MAPVQLSHICRQPQPLERKVYRKVSDTLIIAGNDILHLLQPVKKEPPPIEDCRSNLDSSKANAQGLVLRGRER